MNGVEGTFEVTDTTTVLFCVGDELLTDAVHEPAAGFGAG